MQVSNQVQHEPVVVNKRELNARSVSDGITAVGLTVLALFVDSWANNQGRYIQENSVRHHSPLSFQQHAVALNVSGFLITTALFSLGDQIIRKVAPEYSLPITRFEGSNLHGNLSNKLKKLAKVTGVVAAGLIGVGGWVYSHSQVGKITHSMGEAYRETEALLYLFVVSGCLLGIATRLGMSAASRFNAKLARKDF